MERRWELAEPVSAELRESFPELHPVTLQLLANRGLVTQEEVDEFLHPDYGQDLHSPSLFRQAKEACERLWRAFADGERVVVHGDYDADGVTGTAILLESFREVSGLMGGDPELVTSYIPHREHEGYGLHRATVDRLHADGADLIVTVDCGISNAAEVAHAKSLGLDVMVVDHHQVPENVPDCIIVHPMAPGDEYPFKRLAAAGVAFKLASALLDYGRERGLDIPVGREKWFLDLVAIATVTDFMPLLGENRTLEKYGLIVLNKTRRHGLRKLIEAAGLEPGRLDTVSVGFYLGPRINAASRMEHADLALETLMADTPERAAEMARKLNLCNAERQRQTQTMATEALAMADRGKPIQMLASESWAPGIVGIVAGRLVTELGVPSFVFGRDGDRFVGSGRSIEGFDVTAMLNAGQRWLARYGGHPEACGLTIEGEENFRKFVEFAEGYARERLEGRDLRPKVRLECALETSQVTWDLIEELERFEPFGEANPKPLFMFRGVQLMSTVPVGKDGKHCRVGVRGSSPREFKCIAFNFTERMSEFEPGSLIDLVGEVGVNEWNGNRTIQLRIVDVRQHEPATEKASL